MFEQCFSFGKCYWVIFSLCGILSVASSSAWCQVGQVTGAVSPSPFGFGQPQGVYVDAKGVVQFRQDDRTKQLRRIRKTRGNDLVYISLPRLFGEARKKIEADEDLPDELRNLNGLVKLQYVFVFPEEKDLVIAGPSEKWDPKTPSRPLGTSTGQPILQLEDLVVALRTLGPGRPAVPFGCSIDLTQEALNRVVSAAKRIGPIRAGSSSSGRAASQTLARACGPQPVRFFGVEPETQFGFTCLQADYLMKMLSLGTLRSPIRGIQSHASMRDKGKGIYFRWWFVDNYQPLLVSEDGNSYEIRGQGIAVLAGTDPPGSRNVGQPPSRSAERFAQQMTEHFDELARAVPTFAELRNVTDLGVLAALIAEDRLHERIGWDLSWVLDPTILQVPKVAIPKTAKTLVSYRFSTGKLKITVGGAQFSLREVVAAHKREQDDIGVLHEKSHRPIQDHWSLLAE